VAPRVPPDVMGDSVERKEEEKKNDIYVTMIETK
jgi:hypothetical protein